MTFVVFVMAMFAGVAQSAPFPYVVLSAVLFFFLGLLMLRVMVNYDLGRTE